jgi:hypothetical protein
MGSNRNLLGAAAAVAVVLVAIVAGYAAGSNRDSVRPTAAAAPQTPQTPVATQAAGTPQPAAGAGAAQPAATHPQMDEAAFWQLIADTRTAAGNDTGRQSGLLEQRLSRLPAQQIVDFQRIRHRLDQQAYTWDIWGAAYVIEDGCSDDCFRDFRSYLISLGRGPYEAALKNPDSLAPVVQDAETGDWENADSVAGDAYQSATGNDIPTGDSDLSGNPRGTPWDSKDQEMLVRRYPGLAARFR